MFHIQAPPVDTRPVSSHKPQESFTLIVMFSSRTTKKNIMHSSLYSNSMTPSIHLETLLSVLIGYIILSFVIFLKNPKTSFFVLFNDLFASNSFPNSWKESIIVTILKPGKTRNNPKHYRPISMTSCLGKLLERMVSKRLTFFLEQQQILSKYQCGFRKQHSTMDHLVRLESDIRKGFFKKQHTTAIFLDIKNAYDMVFKPAVIYKIHKLGIKGNMAQYLSNFLSGNRLFRVKHRSIFSNTYEAETGLPQGSCLSPILFNIIIDDLFHDIPPGISYSLFADDSAIWCTTDDFDNGIYRLQIALNKVEQWSTIHGLEFLC